MWAEVKFLYSYSEAGPGVYVPNEDLPPGARRADPTVPNQNHTPPTLLHASICRRQQLFVFAFSEQRRQGERTTS